MDQSKVIWRLLGPVTVETGDGPVLLTPRPRAVVQVLLAHANHVVSPDVLGDAIWGGHPPKTVRNSIARFVADARRSLGSYGERIVTVGGNYRIEVHNGELDLDAARSALKNAVATRAADPDRAFEMISAGVALFASWPNSSLVALGDIGAVVQEIEELRIYMLELAANLQLQLGQHQVLISSLERAVADYPFHERFWAQLIVALSRSGRRAEALDAYQRLRHTLIEIGLEPGTAIRRLEAEIVAEVGQGPADDRGHEPPTPADVSQYRIAEPRTSFVGREVECAEIQRALAHHRLVSIVGLGGCGKTRVALAAIHDSEAAAGEVYRVGLRPLVDPTLVLPAIASVMQVTAGRATTDATSLGFRLRHRSFLLVLDNCEHLRNACVEVIEALLDQVPGARVLTTSRQPLNVSGEAVYRLAPLECPPPDTISATYPAVALFVERAQAQARSLDLGPEALFDIGEVCRAVGGLPIAVELAAAQLAYMAPADLVDRLAEPLGSASAADGPAGVLSSVLDWSWNLLNADEQALLARLSVFGDSWTLDAAQFVAGETAAAPRHVSALVDKSLVTTLAARGRVRYTMLESVSRYASERLAERGETEATNDRLVQWLEELTEGWTLAEMNSWAGAIDAVEIEHDNLLAALTHLRAMGRDGELAWLAVRAAGVWSQRGFPSETFRWLLPVVEDERLSDDARSAAAMALMDASSAVGDANGVSSWGARSLELSAERPVDWVPHVAGVLAVLSLIFELSMTTDELLERSITVARASTSSDTNLALAAIWRGHLEFGRRNYDAALGQFRVARAHCQPRGRILLLSEVGEGLALHASGHHQQALEAATRWQSDPATDEWHYIIDVARAIIVAGAGHPDEATAELVAALGRLRPSSVWSRADDYQVAFALLADFRGDHELAEQLLDSPLPGQPLLATIVIDHVARQRGRTGESGWRLTAVELLSRAPAASDDDGGRGGVPASLVAWWAHGIAKSDVTRG